MSSSKEPVQDEQYVVFRLAKEQYGIAIGAVREIILRQDLTRLPEMPAFMEGMINLRGRIIPVINLHRRFGLPDEQARQESRTVVAEIGGVEAGLLVDDVIGVLRIPATAVQPPPEITAAGSAVVQGVARLEDRLVILLDPDLILRGQERMVLLDPA